MTLDWTRPERGRHLSFWFTVDPRHVEVWADFPGSRLVRLMDDFVNRVEEGRTA